MSLHSVHRDVGKLVQRAEPNGFLLAGQEADKGPVRRAGPPPELLQVHSTGVQRDVPSLLHQAAALQSHQVPTAVQIDGASPLPC